MDVNPEPLRLKHLWNSANEITTNGCIQRSETAVRPVKMEKIQLRNCAVMLDNSNSQEELKFTPTDHVMESSKINERVAWHTVKTEEAESEYSKKSEVHPVKIEQIKLENHAVEMDESNSQEFKYSHPEPVIELSKINVKEELVEEHSIKTEQVQFEYNESMLSHHSLQVESKYIKSEFTFDLNEMNVEQIEDDKSIICYKAEDIDYMAHSRLEEHHMVSEASNVQKLSSYQNKDCENLPSMTDDGSLQLKLFKCNRCSYESKRKHNLKQHQLVHEDASQLKMFKCNECSFESKWKCYLRKHQLLHKDPSQLIMYKCNECTFETKWKNLFQSHQRVHRDPSELEIFKCNECTFETKWKRYLRQHQVVHKDPSQLEMFKCSKCSFECKLKYILQRHYRVHEDPSQLKMFKCHNCSFETKYKCSLVKHLMSHKR